MTCRELQDMRDQHDAAASSQWLRGVSIHRDKLSETNYSDLIQKHWLQHIEEHNALVEAPQTIKLPTTVSVNNRKSSNKGDDLDLHKLIANGTNNIDAKKIVYLQKNESKEIVLPIKGRKQNMNISLEGPSSINSTHVTFTNRTYFTEGQNKDLTYSTTVTHLRQSILTQKPKVTNLSSTEETNTPTEGYSTILSVMLNSSTDYFNKKHNLQKERNTDLDIQVSSSTTTMLPRVLLGEHKINEGFLFTEGINPNNNTITKGSSAMLKLEFNSTVDNGDRLRGQQNVDVNILFTSPIDTMQPTQTSYSQEMNTKEYVPTTEAITQSNNNITEGPSTLLRIILNSTTLKTRSSNTGGKDMDTDVLVASPSSNVLPTESVYAEESESTLYLIPTEGMKYVNEGMFTRLKQLINTTIEHNKYAKISLKKETKDSEILDTQLNTTIEPTALTYPQKLTTKDVFLSTKKGNNTTYKGHYNMLEAFTNSTIDPLENVNRFLKEKSMNKDVLVGSPKTTIHPIALSYSQEHKTEDFFLSTEEIMTYKNTSTESSSKFSKLILNSTPNVLKNELGYPVEKTVYVGILLTSPTSPMQLTEPVHTDEPVTMLNFHSTDGMKEINDTSSEATFTRVKQKQLVNITVVHHEYGGISSEENDNSAQIWIESPNTTMQPTSLSHSQELKPEEIILSTKTMYTEKPVDILNFILTEGVKYNHNTSSEQIFTRLKQILNTTIEQHGDRDIFPQIQIESPNSTMQPKSLSHSQEFKPQEMLLSTEEMYTKEPVNTPNLILTEGVKYKHNTSSEQIFVSLKQLFNTTIEHHEDKDIFPQIQIESPNYTMQPTSLSHSQEFKPQEMLLSTEEIYTEEPVNTPNLILTEGVKYNHSISSEQIFTRLKQFVNTTIEHHEDRDIFPQIQIESPNSTIQPTSLSYSQEHKTQEIFISTEAIGPYSNTTSNDSFIMLKSAITSTTDILNNGEQNADAYLSGISSKTITQPIVTFPSQVLKTNIKLLPTEVTDENNGKTTKSYFTKLKVLYNSTSDILKNGFGYPERKHTDSRVASSTLTMIPLESIYTQEPHNTLNLLSTEDIKQNNLIATEGVSPIPEKSESIFTDHYKNKDIFLEKKRKGVEVQVEFSTTVMQPTLSYFQELKTKTLLPFTVVIGQKKDITSRSTFLKLILNSTTDIHTKGLSYPREKDVNVSPKSPTSAMQLTEFPNLQEIKDNDLFFPTKRAKQVKYFDAKMVNQMKHTTPMHPPTLVNLAGEDQVITTCPPNYMKFSRKKSRKQYRNPIHVQSVKSKYIRGKDKNVLSLHPNMLKCFDKDLIEDFINEV